MIEQEWWQKRLPRPRPVQPQRLPPLNPSMLNEPVMQGEPMRPSAVPDQGAPVGFPMPEQMEAPVEQMPPRITPDDIDYAQLNSPPKKTNKVLDALYIAAQAAGNIFDTEGNQQPIERLGVTKKRQKDAEAMQRIQARNMRRKADQDSAYRDAQTQNIFTDNARQQGELERKVTKDTAQIKYWERKADQGDWKLINDEKLLELRDKWAESKNDTDKRRLDLVEKEMTYRNVRSKLDRESRERIAGWRESGMNRRQQLASEARQLLTQFQEAQRNNRAEEQRALQERLAEIKAEAQANP